MVCATWMCGVRLGLSRVELSFASPLVISFYIFMGVSSMIC